MLWLLWCWVSVASEPLRVVAASSLGPALTDLTHQWAATANQPAPTVVLGGSGRLAAQLQAGYQADVVVLADPLWMDALTEAALVNEASVRTLAHNTLVVAVPSGAAWRPQSLAQLIDTAHQVALGGEGVPVGDYARQAIWKVIPYQRGLPPQWVQLHSAQAVAALVAEGRVDAGLVYATDAMAHPTLETAFQVHPAGHNPIAYPLALTSHAAPDAHHLAKWLMGPVAQARLRAAGFVPPKATTAPQQLAPMAPAIRGGSQHQVLGPVLRTLWVGGIAVLGSFVPGLLLAWLLARRDFIGKSLVSTLLLMPLVLPPVVTGYGLLWVFGRGGPLGALGVAFSSWAPVVAAMVVGFPLLVLALRQAIERVDPRYEQLAETLGAHPLRAFVRVTVPLALPGIAGGTLLAFARALGEFGATVVLAGDSPDTTRTIALAVYALYDQPGGDPSAVGLILVSVSLSLLALIGFEALSRWQHRRLEDR